MKKLCYALALLLSNCLLVKAQPSVRPDHFTCGIKDLTPAQAEALKQQAILALKKKMVTQTASATITYVPIRPHIIRRSDGTGGFSLDRMNHAMALANSHFLLNGSGLQFYFAGVTPDYINDNNLFTTFPQPEGTSVNGRDAYNALNQYYVNYIDGGYTGYANWPTGEIYSTHSFISVSFYNTDYLGNRLIPHELGHNFILNHTFGLSNGNYPTDELVTRGNGANCASAGDAICDTPADPFGMSGTSYIYSNGCPQYDPNSTARDANGDAYSPSMTNIMSYYNSCTTDFTPGQYERMQNGLALHHQPHTIYKLDAPATNVVPVSNLTATSNLSAVVLTWQDNADNEMGYFIERSTSPTTDFVPIGGTAPNETQFVDSKVTANTQYYYRIRPSNTTTGSISSIASVLALPLPPVTGLITTNVTQTSARLTWNSLGEGVQYEVQWRPAGAANWLSNSTFEPFYALSELSMNTAYEWQVRAAGSDTYSGPVSFTTGVGCRLQVPGYLSTSPLVTSAVLRWEPVLAGANTNFNVRYRIVGTSDWTNISNVSSASANITGLTGSTTYEWQVRTVCNNGGATSGFSSLYTFSTSSCIPPTNLQATTVTTSSAQLSWGYGLANAETSYQVRYRIVGTADWIVVNSPPTSTMGSSLTLTGLISNATYEWQVRVLCSATETSDFSSPSVEFQTLPIEPDLTPILYVRPSPTYGNTTLSVVLDLVELNGQPTGGLITVKITKDARAELTFDTNLTNLAGRSVQNGVWSFSSSDANYYVLTTTQPVPAGDRLSVGLSGTLSPGSTTGKLTISATVLGDNTVDSKPTNNIDADKIDYFQQ